MQCNTSPYRLHTSVSLEYTLKRLTQNFVVASSAEFLSVNMKIES